MTNFWMVLGIVWLGLNLYAFILMGWDKCQAKKKGDRLSEKRLLGTALVGGSLGVYLGMRMWRHKTQKMSFKWRFYAIVLLQLTLIGLYGSKQAGYW